MATINTLLLSGQNNHDWKRSTPRVKEILDASGKFAVTVTENPPEVLDNAAALRQYQLLFSDYNGPRWGAKAEANFVDAVRGGTGLVILHAADNAFVGWKEYEQMCALMWSTGTGHGEFHEFTVDIVDKEHPITRGIASFKHWDELYHKLVHMQNTPYHVLAEAYSDPKTKGTGNREPMLVTLQFGKGRVFHDILGHIWAGDGTKHKGCSLIAFEDAAFKTTLIRGSEWAATGRVTD
ncbi:MAG: ThuA domain-containing protein [Planctomycetota bacterium]|nr:ThuA domain-containing protein [Planctomycetota bacterium]